MKNDELARFFDRMADLLEIQGENPFRVRAYRRASQSLENLGEDVEAIAKDDRLGEIPGIGKDLADKIREILQTGRMKDLDARLADIPAGVVELMSVPGLGPKTAKLLHEKAGVRNLDELEALAREGRLRGLPGVQAKAEANILKGIALIRARQARMPLGRARPLANELVETLERLPEVRQLALAGSIRRGKETIGDIDILVTSTDPGKIMEAFTRAPRVREVIGRGGTKASVRLQDGIQVDLRVVEPDAFGAALVYFTGSQQHNIRIREMAVRKGLKISEYGVFSDATGKRVAAATEEDVYATLGLPWIAPELREDTGEIEAALAGRLPRLIERTDVRGDLHDHTDASDGGMSIEALVEAARGRGYEYVLVSDHSAASAVAGGLSVEELRAHVARIREVQQRRPDITILAGSECDILADGSMDYPDEVLAELDLVVGAVHSRLTQARPEMTERLCAALANPYVSILAHPTGRIFGEREGVDVDLDQVFRAAERHGKAVEINASPRRADLTDVLARRAVELGALIAISTDTHKLADLANMDLGVSAARRAWIEPARVINTWPLEKLRAWVKDSRSHGRARTSGGLS